MHKEEDTVSRYSEFKRCQDGEIIKSGMDKEIDRQMVSYGGILIDLPQS